VQRNIVPRAHRCWTYGPGRNQDKPSVTSCLAPAIERQTSVLLLVSVGTTFRTDRPLARLPKWPQTQSGLDPAHFIHARKQGALHHLGQTNPSLGQAGRPGYPQPPSQTGLEFFRREGVQAMERRQRRSRQKEDGHRRRTGSGRRGRPRRNPMTWGSHLPGRTKNRAEPVLAIILGRDIWLKVRIVSLHVVRLSPIMMCNLGRQIGVCLA
jgi:hypothetical protein